MIRRSSHAQTLTTAPVIRRASSVGMGISTFGLASDITAATTATTGINKHFHRHMNRPAARGGPS